MIDNRILIQTLFLHNDLNKNIFKVKAISTDKWASHFAITLQLLNRQIMTAIGQSQFHPFPQNP